MEAVMDGLKILEVIGVYRKFFESHGIDKADYPHYLKPGALKNTLAHCHGMLDKMEVFIKEGRIEKTFRWLGFIQGCLWMAGCYSLDDLKNHNRPAKDSERRKNEQNNGG